jgi:MFS family permease
MTLTGTGFYSFAAALAFLGVGWNFLFVGGTTLLTTTYAPVERGRAQAANDMSIYVVGVASSLAAGALLNIVGWQVLNLILLPWLGLAALALAWLGVRRRHGSFAQP